MTAAVNSLTLRSDWHRVGAGFSVRFALVAGRFDAEWRPHLPTKREWKRIEFRYRGARHLFLEAIAGAIGAPVACIEPGGAR